LNLATSMMLVAILFSFRLVDELNVTRWMHDSVNCSH
jgi:hypothetical protein